MANKVSGWIVFSFLLMGLYGLASDFNDHYIDSIELKYFHFFIPLSIGLYFNIGMVIRLAKIISGAGIFLFIIIALLPLLSKNMKINNIAVTTQEATACYGISNLSVCYL